MYIKYIGCYKYYLLIHLGGIMLTIMFSDSLFHIIYGIQFYYIMKHHTTRSLLVVFTLIKSVNSVADGAIISNLKR